VSVPTITNYFNGIFSSRYGWNPANWPNGLLPNAWNFYDATQKKAPFTNDGRDFGPKLGQTKKAKATVNWVTHY
jgi:hypothetical protein